MLYSNLLIYLRPVMNHSWHMPTYSKNTLKIIIINIVYLKLVEKEQLLKECMNTIKYEQAT
jgi:hypothetical protein